MAFNKEKYILDRYSHKKSMDKAVIKERKEFDRFDKKQAKEKLFKNPSGILEISRKYHIPIMELQGYLRNRKTETKPINNLTAYQERVKPSDTLELQFPNLLLSTNSAEILNDTEDFEL